MSSLLKGTVSLFDSFACLSQRFQWLLVKTCLENMAVGHIFNVLISFLRPNEYHTDSDREELNYYCIV